MKMKGNLRASQKKTSEIVLGIDIGGTGIKGSLVDIGSGKLLEERYRIDTPKGGKVEDIAASVGEIVKHFKWKGKIGCTLPAVVQSGVVRTAANISKKWIGVNGLTLLSKATKCSVALLNDADAAGVAEMKFGAGKGRSGVVLLVTLGTGIGTALFVDGKLVPNTELGHLIVREKDAEEFASNRVREEKDLSWKKWAKNVDEYLEYIESLIWPNCIIIGGGVSKSAEKFIPRISINAKVVPAKLLNDAGIVGAALATRPVPTL
jgi:polyphosphate glucokinase